MKTIVAFTGALLIAFSSYGQFITGGPRGGVSSSRIKMDEIIDGSAFRGTDAITGWHAGAFFRMNLPLGMYLQPELLYSQTGGNFLVESGEGTSTGTLQLHRFDLPVLLGFRFLGIMRANAGVVGNFMLGAQQDLLGERTSVKDRYKSPTMGYQAGIGLDLWKLLIDLKYEGSLSSIAGENIRILGTDFSVDQRNPQWILSVGFRF